VSAEQRESLIKEYFSMWLTRNGDRLEDMFAEDALYVESNGNEYRGSHQIINWFNDWFSNGVVKCWDISEISHCGNRSFVEWHFECVCYNNPSAFDGVSIVDFSDDGKIHTLREFAAASEHELPYDN